MCAPSGQGATSRCCIRHANFLEYARLEKKTDGCPRDSRVTTELWTHSVRPPGLDESSEQRGLDKQDLLRFDTTCDNAPTGWINVVSCFHPQMGYIGSMSVKPYTTSVRSMNAESNTWMEWDSRVEGYIILRDLDLYLTKLARDFLLLATKATPTQTGKRKRKL